MTRVRNSDLRENRTTVISDSEFQSMLERAVKIENVFFRLRTLCILAILRLTGKRRGEIAQIKRENVKIAEKFLEITFILEKKRTKKLQTATKSIPLSDSLLKYVLDYLEMFEKGHVKAVYLFPRVKSVFGMKKIIVLQTHISGRHIFNIVRSVTSEAWPHLFRETVGSDVIGADPTLIGVFKVKRRLDLASYQTAFNYLERYASDVIAREDSIA